MKRYLVVADDFTGANDSGVQMRKYGIDVDVVLFPEARETEGSLVLDTESRNMPGEQAAALVREKAAAVLGNNRYDLIYKKIDSTLRGNIVEELEALRDLCGAKTIVFCPAFPKIGRTTVEGIHRLHDTRLLETEFAKDPEKPIRSDVLPELVAPLGSVKHHGLEEIRAGNIALEGADVHTFDAEKTSDLLQIAALAETDPDILWVGSAGLINAIFESLHKNLPVLSVVGSVSAVSLEQMAHAADSGVQVIHVSAGEILSGETGEARVDEIAHWLEEGADVILTATRHRDDYEQTVQLAASDYQKSSHEAAKLVQSYLADLTKRILERTKVSGLFLTGGDTAISVIRALEGSGSKIRREVLTAIVLSTLTGGPYDGLKMITKAGAFGKPEDLLFCIERIKEGLA